MATSRSQAFNPDRCEPSRLARTGAASLLLMHPQDPDKIGHAGAVSALGRLHLVNVCSGLSPLPNPSKQIDDPLHCLIPVIESQSAIRAHLIRFSPAGVPASASYFCSIRVR